MQHQSSHFDEILLPPVMVATMYGQTLVLADKNFEKPIKQPAFSAFTPHLASPEVTDALEAAPAQNFSQSIARLGDFLKSVLVLVDDTNNVYLGEAELELLGKMLQALKLSFADIAIVNIAGRELAWNSLSEQLPAKHIMLFGVEPKTVQIPVRFPHFRVQKWSNASFLYSPSLAEINRVSPDQVTYKKELWRALQDLFSIN